MKKMAESRECPLNFYDFSPVDHTKACPRYTAVLQREESEGIGIEELDTLQLELETLLAAVSRRMRQLDSETQILAEWQEKKDVKKGGKPTEEVKVATPSGKRGRTDSDKPEKKPKKAKESAGGGKPGATAAAAAAQGAKDASGGTPGKPKVKSIHQKLQEYEFTDDPVAEAALPRVPRNDAPDRFWSSVEPYCAEVTSDDLKSMEEMLTVGSSDDDGEYYKVPTLGKHYSLRWAQEDLAAEQKEGSRISDKKKSASITSNGKDAKSLLKKVERDEDSCPFGPLTQRLISALVEENIMTPLEDIIMESKSEKAEKDEKESKSPRNGKSSPRNGSRPFTVPHTRALEARIREELFTQGLLDVDDSITEDIETDEVLAELQKRQAELRALSSHNRNQKNRLVRLAKEEMKRQELRQKMRAADNETMEAFRRIMAARQKKRSPTKKEKDQAWKVLKERETLAKQLNSM
ncbi:transcriptional adapter 3-like [Amphiura filiformis]|uniref:transcriptional adapter 3-like n=1 Tax=Amphiura filiformis TaxID=82378 RepID=UPI003B20DC8B